VTEQLPPERLPEQLAAPSLTVTVPVGVPLDEETEKLTV
jgi:hypothetical protein